MLKQEISKLLKDYLEYYHLSDWKGGVSSRLTKSFGKCFWSEKYITISQKLAKINPDWRVIQTVKHEIAHALAGPHQKHSKIWKNVCLAIGGNGESRYTNRDTNTLNNPHSISLNKKILTKTLTAKKLVTNSNSKVYAWKNKSGKRIVITQTYV